MKHPEPSNVVSYLEYKKQDKLCTLFFPVPQSNISEDLAVKDLEEEFATCLMQRGKGTLNDQESAISKESCTLISHKRLRYQTRTNNR